MSGDVNAAAETIRLALTNTTTSQYLPYNDAGLAALDALVAEVERLQARVQLRDEAIAVHMKNAEQLRAERDAALNREQEVIDTANDEIRALRVEKQQLEELLDKQGAHLESADAFTYDATKCPYCAALTATDPPCEHLDKEYTTGRGMVCLACGAATDPPEEGT